MVPEGYFDNLTDRLVTYKNLAELDNPGAAGGFTVPEGYFDELAANIQSRISIQSAVNNEETGFAVPEGYFDELTANIQSRVNIESAVNNEETAFAVPEGYFDELAATIQSRINIESAVNNGETGFSVPEGYFEGLSATIQSRINIEGIVNKEETAFAVPEGYFENLSKQIESRIFVEEALSSQVEAFAVPQDYFDSLNKSILAKTVNLENKQRKGIVRKLFASTAFKYATAACFALAIGGGILISQLSGPADAHKNSFLHKQLSTVPIDDIKAYLQLNTDVGDAQQSVAADSTAVDENKLKSALQNDVDSVQ